MARSPFSTLRSSGLQALSLDVTLGVLCAASLAVAAAGVDPPTLWWCALPLSTWCVYVADRQLDARRAGAGAHNARHRFHHRHRRPLLWLLLAACLSTAAVAAIGLPRPLLGVGVLVGLGASAHLARAQLRSSALPPKELTAAVVYTAGIWCVPLYLVDRVRPALLCLIVLHFLTALLNLMVFGLFEERTDRLDGQTSLARSQGIGATRRAAWAVALAAWGVGVGLIAAGPAHLSIASLALTALVTLHGLMLSAPRWFAPAGRYRTLGDLGFCVTALPFLLAWLETHAGG